MLKHIRMPIYFFVICILILNSNADAAHAQSLFGRVSNFPTQGSSVLFNLPYSSNLPFSADSNGFMNFPNTSINIYVSSSSGNDDNPGTLSSPVQTLAQGVKLWH